MINGREYLFYLRLRTLGILSNNNLPCCDCVLNYGTTVITVWEIDVAKVLITCLFVVAEIKREYRYR